VLHREFRDLVEEGSVRKRLRSLGMGINQMMAMIIRDGPGGGVDVGSKEGYCRSVGML